LESEAQVRDSGVRTSDPVSRIPWYGTENRVLGPSLPRGPRILAPIFNSESEESGPEFYSEPEDSEPEIDLGPREIWARHLTRNPKHSHAPVPSPRLGPKFTSESQYSRNGPEPDFQINEFYNIIFLCPN